MPAKTACNEVIEKTNLEFVEMGLVQFGMGSRASVLQELCRNPRKLRAAVARLDADGGTPMAEAIELGTALVTGSTGDGFLERLTGHALRRRRTAEPEPEDNPGGEEP